MIVQTRTDWPEDDVFVPETADGMPILYEDEEEEDMGESNIHVISAQILHVCIGDHLAPQTQYQVFLNMNLYYLDGPLHPRTRSKPYVSPDVMVVEPFERLEGEIRSYTVAEDGPAPLLTVETLSQRSAQQRDKQEKVVVYARLRVSEYILADVTGRYLPERLVLKRLQPDGTYKDERDTDGGVTSRLGFRVIIDEDCQLRVLNAATGMRYARPGEAGAEAKARRKAEERLQKVEERFQKTEERLRAEAEARRKAEDELARLKAELEKQKSKRKKKR